MAHFLKSMTWFLLILLAPIANAAGPEPLTGDWHGTLDTPQGALMLLVTLQADGQQVLSGVLESRTQAPGVKIPLKDVQAQSGSMKFQVPSITGSYQGTWNEDRQQWEGVFAQQLSFPLNLKRGALPVAAVVRGLDGTWQGTLRRNDVDLRLVLRVRTDDQGTVATLDSPDLGAFGMPVTGFNRDGESVSFDVQAAAVGFKGLLNADSSTVTGQWSRPGQPDATVSFQRTDASTERPDQVRPQMPSQPLSYRAEEVSFGNPQAEGVTLAGTLTWPEGKGPFPAAVLISGSGAQDRDQHVFGHRTFAVLSDHLTRAGIAVLRVDDRGVNESTGDHAAATSADFATDANAAANYLLGLDGINHDAVGFVGHSEGGMIGPLAVLDNDRIAYLVMLAGPGTSTSQLIETQRHLISLSQGVSKAELDRTDPVFARINQSLIAATDQADAQARVRAILAPAALESLGIPAAQGELMVQQLSRDWYRYFLQYDATSVLKQLRIPVLAINGALDLQVPADENLAAIAAALRANPDAITKKLEGLNHMFQTTTTGAFGEYPDLTETFAPVALETVSSWILERFAQ